MRDTKIMVKGKGSERAARALCEAEGLACDIRFEGAPMWQSFLPQVRTVLAAIADPGVAHGEEWTRLIAHLRAQAGPR